MHIFTTAQVTEGLTGRWTFCGDEKQGLRDMSGNSLHAINKGRPLATGHSFAFKGHRYQLVIPASTLHSADAMMVTVWLKEIGRCDGPIINFWPSWCAHVWYMSKNGLFARFNGQQTDLKPCCSSGKVRPVGAWHFLAATHDRASGITQLWIDGAKDASVQAGHHALGVRNHIGVGKHIGRPLQAELRDLRVYSRALGGKELKRVARENPPPQIRKYKLWGA